MRLLYVIDSLVAAGAETSLVEMAPGLIGAGIDLHVLPLTNRLDLAPKLVDLGARVHLPPDRTGRVNKVFAVRRAIQEIGPDLVHTTLYEADIAGRLAAWMQNTPCSTTWASQSYGSSHNREVHPLKLALARQLDAMTAQLAGRFHAVSEAVAEGVAPALRVPTSAVTVIPRGRDPERFPLRTELSRDAARRALGVSAETPLILGVGRLEPMKGFAHLLRSLERVSLQIPDAVVMIAGRPGRDTSVLEGLATKAPLEVQLLGERSDIPALLSAADVLAFPSEREGSPGTLIEAMASGTPIVSSDISPCLEVLGGKEQTCALHFPSGDHVALAQAIVEVLQEPEAAAERASLARNRFESNYSIESVSSRMVEFFRESAASPRTFSRKAR